MYQSYLNKNLAPIVVLGPALLVVLGLSGCGDDFNGSATGNTGSSNLGAGNTGQGAPNNNGGGNQPGNDATKGPNDAGTASATGSGKPPCVGVDPEGPKGLRWGRPNGSRADFKATNTQDSSTSSTASDSGTDTATQGDHTGTGSHGCESPGCIGDMSPLWELHDYQPLSCGYGKAYGFPDFLGKPIMVVFLAGWCPYCQGQATGLERMRLELEQGGHDFNFAIIHTAGANSAEHRQAILDRTSIPLFQDTDFTDLAGRLKAHKDEMFLYDLRGILRESFLHEDTRPSNLSTPEGYNLVRDSFIKIITSR